MENLGIKIEKIDYQNTNCEKYNKCSQKLV